jgi:hypothetical protein
MRVCPFCGDSSNARRSHRRGLDVLFGIIGWRPFRCEGCTKRFYAFGWSKLRLAKTADGNGSQKHNEATQSLRK